MDQGWEEKLRICTAYRYPDGTLTTSVPRSEEIRQTLEPVYETFDGWKEDLGSITSYHQLPKEAKAYLCRMVGSLLEVAYPEGHDDFKLPQIRFIGVGPDPGQIISDVPPTEKLMTEESFTHSVSRPT